MLYWRLIRNLSLKPGCGEPKNSLVNVSEKSFDRTQNVWAKIHKVSASENSMSFTAGLCVDSIWKLSENSSSPFRVIWKYKARVTTPNQRDYYDDEKLSGAFLMGGFKTPSSFLKGNARTLRLAVEGVLFRIRKIECFLKEIFEISPWFSLWSAVHKIRSSFLSYCHVILGNFAQPQCFLMSIQYSWLFEFCGYKIYMRGEKDFTI